MCPVGSFWIGIFIGKLNSLLSAWNGSTLLGPWVFGTDEAWPV